MIKKHLGLISSLFVLSILLFAFTLKSPVSAQSSCGNADSCEAKIAACAQVDGVWNSTANICESKSSDRGGQCSDSSSFFLGFPTWYKYLEFDDNCELAGPGQITFDDDCSITVDNDCNPSLQIDWKQASTRVGLAVIEIILRISALAALGYVTYGGFKFITSQGEPDAAKVARQTILNGLIGLIIALVATGSVIFIGNLLSS